MTVIEIGRELVALCEAGKDSEAVDRFYDENIVSIEGQGSEEAPARMEGISAIRGKHQWWYDNHEIHSSTTQGPFVGHRDDQFAVLFEMDLTPKATGQRAKMTEVALYTVRGDKIVQEEFLYQMT